MRALIVGMLSAALGGCLTMNPRVEVAEPTNVIPRTPPPPVVANGAIFQQAQYRPLFEDYRARHRGDTLKVEIVEKIVASQKSTSSVDKSGKVDASVTALPGINPTRLTRANAEEMRRTSVNPNTRRLLGVTPELGQSLKLDEAWAYNVVRATLDGLAKMRTPAEVAGKRGKTVEEILA